MTGNISLKLKHSTLELWSAEPIKEIVTNSRKRLTVTENWIENLRISILVNELPVSGQAVVRKL